MGAPVLAGYRSLAANSALIAFSPISRIRKEVFFAFITMSDLALVERFAMARRGARKLIFFVEKRSQGACFYKSHIYPVLFTSLMCAPRALFAALMLAASVLAA